MVGYIFAFWNTQKKLFGSLLYSILCVAGPARREQFKYDTCEFNSEFKYNKMDFSHRDFIYKFIFCVLGNH